METLSRINWNIFNDLKFNDFNHTYTLNGEVLKSCTQLLKEYKNEVINEEITLKYAKKHNYDIQFVKDLWKMKALEGNVKGTLTHFYIESFCKYKIKNEISPLIKEEVNQFHKFYDEYFKDFEFLFFEYRIYDETINLAGTIDCICRDKFGKYYIFDWKTNKDLINEYKQPKMKYPISNIEQTNLNIYELQLSCYQYILQRKLNINIEGLKIVNFSSNIENYKIYDMNYKKFSVEKMINNYLTKNK